MVVVPSGPSLTSLVKSCKHFACLLYMNGSKLYLLIILLKEGHHKKKLLLDSAIIFGFVSLSLKLHLLYFGENSCPLRDISNSNCSMMLF